MTQLSSDQSHNWPAINARIVARDELNKRWRPNNGNYPFWFCSVCTSINFYRLNRLTHVYPLWDKPYTDWRGSSSIMPLSTTVIGSLPKPPYLNIPDWFNPKSMKDFAEKHTRFLQDEPSPEREELISRAIKETFNCNGKQDLMWSPMETGEARKLH